VKRRSPLFAALSPNGRIVHLATRSGRPLCGARIVAVCRVRARVTCRGCCLRDRRRAARFAARPLVVGVDWTPLYAALRRALEAGYREAPQVKVPFWPILGGVR